MGIYVRLQNTIDVLEFILRVVVSNIADVKVLFTLHRTWAHGDILT